MNKKASLYLSSSQAIRVAMEEGYGICLYVKKKITPQLQDLQEYAKRIKLELRYLDAAMSQRHRARNVLLEAAAPPSVDLTAWIRSAPSSLRVALLDRIQDPHNVGAILRSAAFFSFDLVIISEEKSASAHSATVAHTSSGALYLVPTVTVRNMLQSVKMLKKHGVKIYGADAKGTSIRSLPGCTRSAIIIGNEQSGIRAMLRPLCDEQISILGQASLSSLNASVAAGICFYELTRDFNDQS